MHDTYHAWLASVTSVAAAVKRDGDGGHSTPCWFNVAV